MSDLQAYYENFATQPSRWADPDQEVCGCRGRGWWLSELDTWHECPYHKGHRHPEDHEDDNHMQAEEGEFVKRAPIETFDPEVDTGAWERCADDDIPF